jgi:hypothetical protein
MSDETVLTLPEPEARMRWADRIPTSAKGVPNPAVMRFSQAYDNLSIDYAALFSALPDMIYGDVKDEARAV